MEYITNYKKLIPCIYIVNGKAVKWFNDNEVLADDAIALARHYSKHGADELLIFDLSDSDEEHAIALKILQKISRAIRIPMVAGGNLKKLSDIEDILHTGAKRAIINFSKPDCAQLLAEAAEHFGKEKIAVSLNDFDGLFKHQHLIDESCSELVFMHRLDLNSVVSITDVPCVIVTDTMEETEFFKILKSEGVKGLSGKYISKPDINFNAFKQLCEEEGVQMTAFESIMEFSEFKKNEQGLIPVIVQHYKTNEILMLAYMNEESFNQTVKTGRMTYFSRSRQSLWIKGETSGHYQYVKSLTIDCDYDTLLAKVDQVGAACHTGNPTCFFQPLFGQDDTSMNPTQQLEKLYHSIENERKEPVDGSYVTELLDRGQDKLLKKLGEGALGMILSAKNLNQEELKEKFSDYLYHSMMLMVERGITWEDIAKELSEK